MSDGGPSASRCAAPHTAAACSRRLAAAALLAAAAAWPAASPPARADAGSAPDAGSFYARWPYVQPGDILPYLRATAAAGDVDSVLAGIDRFAGYYPMYRCGPEKGAILERLVARQRPALALELGTFMGYGCARIARQLPPGGRLVSIEAREEQAAVAREVLRLAGLPVGEGPEARVQVVSGLSGDVLPRLRELAGLHVGQAAGLVFLDHCKPCYLPDLVCMEELGLVGPGTMVVADNVMVPGTPDYLEHVGAGTGLLGLSALTPEAVSSSSGGGSGGGIGTDGADGTERYCTYRTELLATMFEMEQRWKPDWQPQRDAMSVSICLPGTPA